MVKKAQQWIWNVSEIIYKTKNAVGTVNNQSFRRVGVKFRGRLLLWQVGVAVSIFGPIPTTTNIKQKWWKTVWIKTIFQTVQGSVCRDGIAEALLHRNLHIMDNCLSKDFMTHFFMKNQHRREAREMRVCHPQCLMWSCWLLIWSS